MESNNFPTGSAKNRVVPLGFPGDENLSEVINLDSEENAEERAKRIVDFLELASMFLGSGGYLDGTV